MSKEEILSYKRVKYHPLTKRCKNLNIYEGKAKIQYREINYSFQALNVIALTLLNYISTSLNIDLISTFGHVSPLTRITIIPNGHIPGFTAQSFPKTL